MFIAKKSYPSAPERALAFFIVALAGVLVVIDRFLKTVSSPLMGEDRFFISWERTVVPSYSAFPREWTPALFSFHVAAVVTLIIVLVFVLTQHQWHWVGLLTLLIVGGLSNAIDRWILGGVVDYWAIGGAGALLTTNLADLMVILGMILFAWKHSWSNVRGG